MEQTRSISAELAQRVLKNCHGRVFDCVHGNEQTWVVFTLTGFAPTRRIVMQRHRTSRETEWWYHAPAKGE